MSTRKHDINVQYLYENPNKPHQDIYTFLVRINYLSDRGINSDLWILRQTCCQLSHPCLFFYRFLKPVEPSPKQDCSCLSSTDYNLI